MSRLEHRGSSNVRRVVGKPVRKSTSGNPRSRWVTDFQLGDRVKVADADLEGVVISKSYGDVRYEVRCDNGRYVRELRPEGLALIEASTMPPDE